MITVRILIATAVTTAAAWLVWKGLDALLGRSLVAQVFELGIAGVVAVVLYSWLVLTMRIPEAGQVQDLILGRLRRR